MNRAEFLALYLIQRAASHNTTLELDLGFARSAADLLEQIGESPWKPSPRAMFIGQKTS